MKKTLLVATMFLFPQMVSAGQSLTFFEAQAVAGYSDAEGKAIYRSDSMNAPMQMNSIGIDHIQKFSNDEGEIGSFFFQGRLAYDEDEGKTEAQVYNAYFKLKSGLGDFWAGHNRVAYGLGSYWDTHGALMQGLSMQGVAYERDWGVGYNKDLADGGVQASLTTASGMPLHAEDGSYLASLRAYKGVLGYDNYTMGLSFANGKVIDTMGYEVMSYDPKSLTMGGVDIAFNQDNLEHKFEFDAGTKNGQAMQAALYRLGINLMDENRLKLELQTTYLKQEGKGNNIYSGGLTYLINSDLTSRLMYQYNEDEEDNRIVAQLYYYFRML